MIRRDDQPSNPFWQPVRFAANASATNSIPLELRLIAVAARLRKNQIRV
jgi:hypothetical protein